MLMQALTSVSGVSPKDCIVNNNLVSFLVNEKDMGKAIGRKAINIKELEQALKKKVELVSYSEKPEIVLAKAFEVGIVTAKINDKKLIVLLEKAEKKKVMSNIGRLKRVQELIKRSFGLELMVN